MSTRPTIRFYGSERGLKRWRQLCAETTSKEGSTIKVKRHKFGDRFYFDIAFTAADREKMMVHWYAESGLGTLATGEPYKWNHCVSFEEI